MSLTALLVAEGLGLRLDQFSWIITMKQVGNLVGQQLGGVYSRVIRMSNAHGYSLSTFLGCAAIIAYPMVNNAVAAALSMLLSSTCFAMARMSKLTSLWLFHSSRI